MVTILDTADGLVVTNDEGETIAKVTKSKTWQCGFKWRTRSINFEWNGNTYTGRYNMDSGNVCKIRRKVNEKASNNSGP